ncbi:hypothetical protein GCM10008018_12560 [Paenibacillus marchantiophytorum]|uniref:Uncharacterized protein n=1 Tax=Paenibacillus marchantiophytorum TaxID=1619310 RepID=A0ABQ2BQY5_9BACL|nr:hypothetical protein [Paenibacillus marchantiophytorum]GGI45517.1 hypothetical protein GCM10008018_12560 [Paenibacillus marchantiophytorum]
MKLNWRKIVLIVLCAEVLFIYWNGMSAIPFKKQHITNPISSPQPITPITQLKPATPNKQNESNLSIIDQKAS